MGSVSFEVRNKCLNIIKTHRCLKGLINFMDQNSKPYPTHLSTIYIWGLQPAARGPHAAR